MEVFMYSNHRKMKTRDNHQHLSARIQLIIIHTSFYRVLVKSEMEKPQLHLKDLMAFIGQVLKKTITMLTV